MRTATLVTVGIIVGYKIRSRKDRVSVVGIVKPIMTESVFPALEFSIVSFGRTIGEKIHDKLETVLYGENTKTRKYGPADFDTTR